ncbi:MAG: NAD+ synthase [Vicinamibacterales bacterium]
MRIALAQLNFTVGAFDANFARMREAVVRAQRDQADLLVFSELAATGYPPRDLLQRAGFVDANLALVDRLARLSDDRLGILVGFVDRNPGTDGKELYNAAALCHQGRVIARQHKCLLPSYDVFDEDRYFEPARSVSPIDFRGVKLGVHICEDVWNDPDLWPRRLYHREPVDELAVQGAQLFINLSSSPFDLRKAEVRRRLVRHEARQHGRYFFYVNQVGGNDELVFDGHSLGIDPAGEVVLRGRDFEEDFLVYEVPETALSAPSSTRGVPGILRDVSQDTTEDVWKALVLGLRDYVQKCGFSQAVLGVSGGIDSALTACLAAEALGREQLIVVSMPTRYSSDHSLRDARELAENLGVRHRVIEIDNVFQSYLDALAPTFMGLKPDVTEENIQARVRGTVLMALSNKLGAILLSTGNKSELAVGYCTLYGDMAGGLAVLNDVPKTLVYDLARFANRSRIVIPESTIRKPPSAELRPDQRDTDSLPPYEVLDPIIEAYVERNLSPDAIVREGHDPAVVARVTRMIDTNEYKRRQAAPGIKITTKAFGLGRRFPIAAKYVEGPSESLKSEV